MKPADPFSGPLEVLADLTEIRGAHATAADMRRAAGTIRAMNPADAARLHSQARRGRLHDVPAISPTITWRLRELALGGAQDAIRAARAGTPFLIRRLLDLSAVTPALAVSLVRQLGVVTLPDLFSALDDGRLAPAVGEEVATRLAHAAAALDQERRPVPLGRACDVAEAMIEEAHRSSAVLESLSASGDLRRFEPLVSGVVLVACAADPPAAVDALCGMGGIEDVLHRSLRRAILVRHDTEVDIRVAAPDEFGNVLLATTGNRSHLAALRNLRTRPVLARTEEEVYASAGLPFVAPELRHNSGELEAAAKGALPSLISRSHIRGDLHIHSTYSDGRDTVEAMAEECARLGYDYIAITDHSEGAGASRTLSREDVLRQKAEIERVRGRFPRMAILHGVEVDILPDGRLDFEDGVLEQFDIVLASLHESARQDGRTLTRRCIQAIRHPLVTIISHPANRLVGRRGGYPLDFDAVYAAASETGTALEVDGGPSHLDLDGEHARAAMAAGVTLVIDSDCHRARALDRQMRFGVGTARRGWVEPRHVLNTRSLQEVRGFISAKRSR